MIYKNFFEFWKANFSHESGHIKCIALEAWDAAIWAQHNALTMDMFSNSEVYTEAVLRGFEVRRTDKSDEERKET